MAGILDAVKILTGSAMVLPNAVTLCIVSPHQGISVSGGSPAFISLSIQRDVCKTPRSYSHPDPGQYIDFNPDKTRNKCLLTSCLLLVVLLPSLQAWAEGRQHQELLNHRPKLTNMLSKVTERLLKIKLIAQRVSDWEKPHKLSDTYEFMAHCY